MIWLLVSFFAGICLGWCLCGIMTLASDADDVIEEWTMPMTGPDVIRLADHRRGIHQPPRL